MSVKNKRTVLVSAVAFMAMVAWLIHATPTSANPDYAGATGQACATCHVDPGGGGPLTATGQAFAAISTHSTDPAGAWGSLPAPAVPDEGGIEDTPQGGGS